MIFKIGQNPISLKRIAPATNPKEKWLERCILSGEEADESILSKEVLCEPEDLLVVRNQVYTRDKKIADIFALDSNGNGVIVELKRDHAVLGVETQALQYLADFSRFRGKTFLTRFAKDRGESVEKFEAKIESFADLNADELNKRNRIILVARSFDPSLFSMGAWLSSSGIAFKCVEYTPLQVGREFFISFSVVFDHSPFNPYSLVFGSEEEISRPPAFFWHNIGIWRGQDKEDSIAWWKYLIETDRISASFQNSPNDKGERLLKSYIKGDRVIAYASQFGAIGYGVIEDDLPCYELVKLGTDADKLNGSHLHRLGIAWKNWTLDLEKGLHESDFKKFGIYHPVSTRVQIEKDKAEKLVKALEMRFGSKRI